jgi:hypothetical protein
MTRHNRPLQQVSGTGPGGGKSRRPRRRPGHILYGLTFMAISHDGIRRPGTDATSLPSFVGSWHTLMGLRGLLPLARAAPLLSSSWPTDTPCQPLPICIASGFTRLLRASPPPGGGSSRRPPLFIFSGGES